MNYIGLYFEELINLLIEMAPWLVLGFLIAGILHVFFPEKRINKLLRGKSTKSVVTAALLGIPLPLCSCGVIPTGVSMYKNGASKGSSVSFLISTPQTGVDSIMVTYSLLGWPFAVLRPVVALITGFFGGIITNATDNTSGKNISTAVQSEKGNNEKGFWPARIIKYAFVEFLEDIAKWMVIGLLIAAFIAVLVPADFFATYIHNDLLGMLIILAASIPVYVCATSSVPIAAVLMLKGLSPGAALVFLMAGPATNAATIAVIGNAMGRKTLISYLATIITGALVFGLAADFLIPREFFTSYFPVMDMEHTHEILPGWLHTASAIVLTAAILNIFYIWLKKRVRQKRTITNLKPLAMNEYRVKVKGMTCNHCKSNVETHVKNVEGVDNVDADIGTGEVLITGEKVNLDQVKEAVEGIGYKFDGMG
jgi:uncharacterized protein